MIFDYVLCSNFLKLEIDITVSLKTHGVAAVVSNCRSLSRNNLLVQLSSKLKLSDGTQALDIYGKCAESLATPGPNRITELDQILKTDEDHNPNDLIPFLRKYKFFLAIENSQCIVY